MTLMIPVRCFTCGKVIGQHWESFQERRARGEPSATILTDLGLTRYCCRRMLLAHVDLMDEVGPYG